MEIMFDTQKYLVNLDQTFQIFDINFRQKVRQTDRERERKIKRKRM